MVWVLPFRAVGIGGVKLKVSADTLQKGRQLMDAIDRGTLIDGNGSYELIPEFEYAFPKEEEVLEIQSAIRCNQE